MRDPIQESRLAIHDMLDRMADARAAISGLTYDGYFGSRLHRFATERMIEIISESSRRISDDLKATEPNIPWSKIAGIGNVFRHDYDDVAPEAIWNVIKHDLAELEEALRRILTTIGEDDE